MIPNAGPAKKSGFTSMPGITLPLEISAAL
jgi:hypothetical protein